MGGFEHGRGAAVGVDRAVDPSVAVVAGDDPSVMRFGVGAFNGADDVPDGAQLVVLLEMHVHLHRIRAAEMVGEGQAALPVMRHVRAGHGFKNGGCIFVAERVDRDRRLVHFGRVGDALGVRQIGRRSDARGFGIARVKRHELYGAALHGGVRTHGTARVLVAARVAVVGGVGEDDDARGAPLLGDVSLNAAEVLAVAHKHDLALDVDA